MVPDHGLARVGTMLVQAIIPPLIYACFEGSFWSFFCNLKKIKCFLRQKE